MIFKLLKTKFWAKMKILAGIIESDSLGLSIAISNCHIA